MPNTDNTRDVTLNDAPAPGLRCSSTREKLKRLMARHGVLCLFTGGLLIGITGCELTGGGWIPSLNPAGKKATYGFDVTQPSDFTSDTPAPFTGNITLQDHDYVTTTFPKGVNLQASSGFMWAVQDASGIDPSFPPVALAVAAAPCTINQGGNGGQPGTLVVVGVDTGLGGAQKGDGVAFVVYPERVTDPAFLVELGAETAYELLTRNTGANLLADAIYVNANTIGGGGPGGGNVSINGVPVDLGGSWVSLAVLGVLVAGGGWLRLGLRRPTLRG